MHTSTPIHILSVGLITLITAPVGLAGSWSGVSYDAWADSRLFGHSGFEASIYGDPDRDGTINFVEFGRGTDPLATDPPSTGQLAPRRSASNDATDFSFQLMPDLDEVAWSYWLSNDLVDWRDATAEATVMTTSVDGVDLVTLRVPDGNPVAPALFGRSDWTWLGGAIGNLLLSYQFEAGGTNAAVSTTDWITGGGYDTSRIGGLISLTTASTATSSQLVLGSNGTGGTDVTSDVPVTTWIRSDLPNADKEHSYIFVGSLAGVHDLRGLLSFNLSAVPDAATITSATISLYQDGNTTGNNDNEPSQSVDLELFSLTGSVDNDATWNTAAGLFDTSLAASAGDPSASTAGIEHQFTGPAVIAELQSALAANAVYFGLSSPDLELQSIRHFFVLDGATATGQSGAIGPSLTLTYAVGGATGHLAEAPSTETASTLEAALSGNDYHEFTVEVDNPGGDLLTLLFDHHGAASATDFTSNIAVFTSTSGFTDAPVATDVLQVSSVTVTTLQDEAAPIATAIVPLAEANVNGTLTVRLYFYDDANHADSANRVDAVRINGFTPNYMVNITDPGFRLEVVTPTGVGLPADPNNGLSFLGSAAVSSQKLSQAGDTTTYRVTNVDGQTALVELVALPHTIEVEVTLENGQTGAISLRTGSPGPAAYGLADGGGYESNANLAVTQKTYSMEHNGQVHRFISSFLIWPQQGVAGMSFDRGNGSVSTGPDYYEMENTTSSNSSQKFYYFVGSMQEIYSAHRSARITEGFPGVAPKMVGFEAGWESWDILRWDTNAQTCQDVVDDYLGRGYDVKWMVTGSGFWDNTDTINGGGTTVSFGDFHLTKYPDPPTGNSTLRDYATNNGIFWMIGQRTNFVEIGGPFVNPSGAGESGQENYATSPDTQDGIDNNYFLKDAAGSLIVLTSGVFPKVGSHLVDGNAPGAATWFKNLYDGWGVDGVKEDTMMSTPDHTIYNAPMRAIANSGDFVMARCAAYSSPGTLSRINDTSGASSMSQRAPINYLQYAAVGAPNVYSDSVGFGNMGNVNRTLRHGWFLSLTAGYAFSNSPWNEGWSTEDQDKFKKIYDFHYRYAPYMYSAAVDSHNTGYPYTMTPLHIAFPQDIATYNLANSTNKQFEWLIGESMLATPVLADNSGNSTTLNVYLPPGTWIDYETGDQYTGPTTLNSFSIPHNKTPVFVGGKGVVIQRISSVAPFKAAVFPIANGGSSYTFHHPDGGDSTITNSNTGWNFTTLVVTNTTTGSPVSFSTNGTTGAITFDIVPGNNYELSGGN